MRPIIQGEGCHQIAEVTVFDPARIGVGVATNIKVRCQAMACSVLITKLLDKRRNSDEPYVNGLCKLAKKKWPPEDYLH